MRILAAVSLTLCALVATARADRVLVDRVETRPSRIDGTVRVRALISATVTGGDVIDVLRNDKDKSPLLKLKIGSIAPPFLLGVFESAEVEMALVIMVPTSFVFDADFEAMRTAIETDLLKKLDSMGARIRVQVIGYGSEYTGSKSFSKPGEAVRALQQLEIDPSTEKIPLADVVTHAVSVAAKRPRNPDALARAAVVLISSGIDLTAIGKPDSEEVAEVKKAITAAGENAGKKKVRIHSLAYHPAVDEKGYHPVRPLLALGELSLRSEGTLRWIRTDTGWGPAMGQLVTEIRRQQVVTFFADAAEVENKKLTATMPIGAGPFTSEPASVGIAKCGPEVCEGTDYCVKQVCIKRRVASGGGMVVKALLFGGIGVGGMVLILGVVALVKRRKAHQPPLPTAVAMNVPHGQAYGGPPAAHAAPPVAAPPPGGPVLIVLTGPSAGTRLPVRDGFTVGKAAGSDLDLSHDGFASGNHARILFDGSGWIVLDQGSTNGTFSNGVRITQTRLEPGTTVRFGSTEVRFWVG